MKFRSSQCFSLLQNGSEQNSELIYHPRNGSQRNSDHFPFRGTDGESKFPSLQCYADFFPWKMAILSCALVWKGGANVECVAQLMI
jgi:hypothetical protein